ncbi:MOSC domain protein [Marinomonas gallaica]|uniref:MOSC domain protein n=1 Tax=Marinomonas gallaica TaxID=1806667 RepID=A0A1C3JUQ3_9GAMM|nr:MOSC domain-containing protein [Marinomonas gallaica]SBT18981.1 MOSC domain protein [Marinomonas gallaica]SBT21936.1 MOSC domain protein [Marinomonas gallaica]
MSLIVSGLYIYPVKSCQAVPLQASTVTQSGLLFDRRFMVINKEGLFLTAREYPQLTLIDAKSVQHGLVLTHPSMSNPLPLEIETFTNEYRETEIWEKPVSANITHPSANAWFSELLNQPVELVYFGEHSTRFTSRRPDQPVAFADGYPFLLTTQASLDDLNKSGPQINEMERFRPNIVISGNEAFNEDTWKRIRIGDVIFENVKPCVRCLFITLDPDTAERSPKGEPLRTLAKYRLFDKEGVTFGVNLVTENEGVIAVGDEVEILEYQTPYAYTDKR